jgi:polyhydroxyalkanoate synthesis regulator phasin
MQYHRAIERKVQLFERIAANDIVEAIKLSTALGNCKLNISAQLQNDKMDKIAKFALQYLIWHVIPAEAYKKDSDFKRDTEYSDKLAAYMVATCKSELAELFSDIEITTAKVVKVAPIDKLIKEFKSLGMTEDVAKKMAAEVLEKAKAKTEAKPEKVEEKVEAAVAA